MTGGKTQLPGTLILLVFLNIVVFAVKWYILIQSWSHNVTFFEEYRYLLVHPPSLIFQPEL